MIFSVFLVLIFSNLTIYILDFPCRIEYQVNFDEYFRLLSASYGVYYPWSPSLAHPSFKYHRLLHIFRHCTLSGIPFISTQIIYKLQLTTTCHKQQTYCHIN